VEDKLRDDETESLLEPNRDAEKNIKDIMELCRKANSAVKELEEYMEGNFKDSTGISSDFADTCRNDIKKLKELMLEGENAEGLLAAAGNNCSALTAALAELDAVHGMLNTEGTSISKEEIVRRLNNVLPDYNNSLQYDYHVLEKKKNASDPRKAAAEIAGKKLREITSEAVDIEKSGISMAELPSRRKVVSRDFAMEDSIYTGSESDSENREKSSLAGFMKYDGDLGRLDREVEFSDDGEFASRALGFVSSMGGALKGGLEDMRDEIYINEYILGVFKSSVPALKEDGKEITQYNLRGLIKKNTDTFFSSEVEYILHGNSSEQVNSLMTQGQLLLTRFGLNTLHVYTDPKKKEMAYSTAAALAGWWTGGAGIPILANLIMCSWGMGEAIIDITDLLDGKKVPFFKARGDWKLDIGIEKSKTPESDPRLSFTYYDYLRLFLLLKNPDEKISRIEDLIELNLSKKDKDFKMAGCSTYVRVEAVVSMKYIFLSGPLMPSNVKTKQGRHEFRVLVYEGY
jgi:hypothetical protein